VDAFSQPRQGDGEAGLIWGASAQASRTSTARGRGASCPAPEHGSQTRVGEAGMRMRTQTEAVVACADRSRSRPPGRDRGRDRSRDRASAFHRGCFCSYPHASASVWPFAAISSSLSRFISRAEDLRFIAGKATVAAVTVLHPTRARHIKVTESWLTRRFEEAFRTLDRFLTCLGFISAAPDVGALRRTDLPSHVPVIIDDGVSESQVPREVSAPVEN